ncbi:DUF3099 domain-containing protein [Microbacterium sp. NPDC019599]|uniref:DUF3099 domain-containing protein n=1 Tax=Microbacterium sp. NPDC019599 TaxID=3154690 RepID=UPI0033F8B043
MKNSSAAQSATSLPRAPRDEVSARSTRYLITMGIRVACFILMVAIHPYSWYTWVFAAGAVFLPYIAVVGANVGQDSRSRAPENPERSLPATPSPRPTPATEHPVIRVDEQRPLPIAERPDREPDAPE